MEPSARQRVAPSHGVLGLLGALHARLRRDDGEVSLRMLLPVYERLLKPAVSASERDSNVMHDIQRIRCVLKSQANLFDIVQTFDDRVDECLQLDDKQSDVAMREALRLLVALAGGADGSTFVLRDPTRVASIDGQLQPTSSAADQTLQRRVGECITMDNVDVIAQFHQVALMHTTSLPMDTETVLGRYDFSSLSPENGRQAVLWYPGENKGSDLKMAESTSLQNMFQQMYASSASVPRLIDMPSLPERNYGLPDVTPVKPKTRHFTKMSPAGVDTEVFFFDSTKVIKAPGFDQESVTDASSGEEEDRNSLSWSDFTRTPTAPASWEQLGDLAGAQTQRAVCPSVQPLLMRAVTAVVCGTKSTPANPIVEIDEADIFEDVVKALCGIPSVLFRRSLPTASLVLPRKCRFKLRTASPTSLKLMLEEFRQAGTAFMRLEYLSVYYRQDPSRGGKTAQALADALRMYLAEYQETVHMICQVGTSSRIDTSPVISLLGLYSRTRPSRRQIIQLSDALYCSESGDFVFWRLLSGGELPRGVALLNLLHEKLQEVERQDSVGRMTRLLQWLLVRTAAPYVALLSCYIATGQTPLDLDPHSEFRLSVYSTLQGFEDASMVVGTLDDDIVPKFLHDSKNAVVEIGRLQLLLCSILPQTDLLPADQFRLGNRVTEAQSTLDITRQLVVEMAKRVQASCLNHVASSSIARRPLRSPSKSPRHDETNDEWIANKRKRLEQKHQAQATQRKILDEMVEERRVRRLAESNLERSQDEEMEESRLHEENARVQKGRDLLMAKYTPLIAEAEDRHRYMKWRRDRAVRLSSSKTDLVKLYEEDVSNWERAPVDTAPSLPAFSEEEQAGTTEQVDGLVDDGDAIMEDVKEADRQEEGVEAASAAVQPVSVEQERLMVDSDGGLLWKPRMRVHHVSGGGGADAAAVLYPDHHDHKASAFKSAPAVEPTKFSTVVVTNIPGGGGSDAYESIYGGRLDAAATARARKVDEDKNKDRAGQPLERVEVGGSVIDTEMEETTLSAGGALDGNRSIQDHVDDSAPLRADVSTEEEPNKTGRTSSVDENPALTLLQPSTHFLQDCTPHEDHILLQSVLHQDVVSASSPPPVPFQSLARLSLEEPISLVHEYLDRMALQAVVVKLELKTHLQWLHRIALMSEGLCLDIFARDLLAKLRLETRVFLALPGRLSTMLALAMIEARLVVASNQLPRFDYQVAEAFVTAVASGPSLPSIAEVVEQVTLSYSVSLHLATIFTPQAMGDYLSVHRFLLLTRLTEQETKEIWLSWRKSQLRQSTQDPMIHRRCDLVLHSAQAFLTAFNQAFTSQIIQIRWNELLVFLEKAQSVSQLRTQHEQFVRDARACCFLQADQAQVLQTVHGIADGVWKLGRLIRAAETQGGSLDGLKSQLRSVSDAQATGLRDLLTQLYGLETGPDRCLRAFAKNLILRLNLNGFFADTTVSDAV